MAEPPSAPTLVDLGSLSGAGAARCVAELAGRLSATPAGTGVLLEWGSDPPSWMAATSASEGRRALAAALGALGVPTDPASPRFPLRGPVEVVGVFDPIPPVDPAGERGSVPADGADPARSLDEAPEGRWVVQLHLSSIARPGTVAGSLRFATGPGGVGSPPDVPMALAAHLGRGLVAAETPARLRRFRPGARRVRELRTGRLHRLRSTPGFTWEVGRLDRVLPRPSLARFPPADGPHAHTVLFGATGAGKTALLAGWIAAAIRAGRPGVAFDLHGDLGPSVVGRLDRPARARLIALDASVPGGPGFDLVGAEDDAARTHLLAALRRGADDRGEVYWGHRLERIFDVFVGLTAEEGGSFRDLYDLLTDARRREAARRTTRSEARARFLDELAAIQRRNPEFLWSAAARVGRLLSVEALADLLAPRGPGLDLTDRLEEGQFLLLRLPIARLGPELAGAAATLVATRLFLERTRADTPLRDALLVFDEAQAYGPTLLAELLGEGRKFGLTAVLATQFPGRLADGLREAAAGAAPAHLVLRTPAAGTAAVRDWLGPAGRSVEGLLPTLPVGAAIARLPGDDRWRFVPAPAAPPPPSLDGWWSEVVRSRGAEEGRGPEAPSERAPLEAVLRAIRALERPDRPAHRPAIADRLAAGRPPAATAAGVDAALGTLLRRRWIARAEPDGYRSEAAGRAFLGEGIESGAVREGVVHRALVAEAIALFARRGETLELVPQGRFDTRLPDALLRLLPPEAAGRSPGGLLETLRTRERSWAWRAFGGRDVHVEAEVSGADRRARLRRDLAKAGAASAHCLFLVPDPRRGARVRTLLRELQVPREAATVWVLRLPIPSSGPRAAEAPGGPT